MIALQIGYRKASLEALFLREFVVALYDALVGHFDFPRISLVRDYPDNSLSK